MTQKEESTMTTLDYANYLINYALQHQHAITYFQLQTNLFVLIAEEQRLTGQYPLTETFQATVYGPRLATIANMYRYFDPYPITHCQHQSRIRCHQGKFQLETIPDQPLPETFQTLVKQNLLTLLDITIFKIVDYIQSLPFSQQHAAKIYQHQPLSYPPDAVTLDQPLATLIHHHFAISV